MISQNTPSTAQKYKVILVGDCRVGKTSFVEYVLGRPINPRERKPPTMGVEYKVATVQARGRPINVAIWDTSGAEQYRSVTSSYYRKSQGAILMFDITDRQTFLDLEHWLMELNNRTGSMRNCIVLANKVDLIQSGERQRAVSQQELTDFCVRNNLTFQLTSMVSGQNVIKGLSQIVESKDRNGLMVDGSIGPIYEWATTDSLIKIILGLPIIIEYMFQNEIIQICPLLLQTGMTYPIQILPIYIHVHILTILSELLFQSDYNQ